MIEGNLITTKPGIYYFRNHVNNKYYVGQAVNLRNRFKSHISNFKASRYDTPLYRAMKKYGIDNFEYQIIKTVEEAGQEEDLKILLDKWEIQYIEKYNSYHNGYNQTLGGDAGVLGYKFTEQQLEEHKERGKKTAADGRYSIIVYDKINDIYYDFVNMTEAAKQLNVNTGGLRAAKCRKRCYLNKYYIAESKEDIIDLINTKNQKYNPSISSNDEYLIEYYNYSKQYDNITVKQVCDELNIGKDAVMKRNQKLRELGYTDLPFNSHKTIKYIELVDTELGNTTPHSIEKLSEIFKISVSAMKKQIRKNNLYKKRYSFNIIYDL